jgi:Holliday junction resolvasome RuvABC endonuclease subunit
MNILAIDPGTKTGWASLYQGHVESGVHEFSLGRGDSPGMRFLRFRSFLVDMLMMTKPELVIYERAHMRGGFATDLLVGMTSRVQEECAARSINYEAVHSATLKKFAAGSGRAQKDLMKAHASTRFGRNIESDDEADALCLLDMAMKTFGGRA